MTEMWTPEHLGGDAPGPPAASEAAKVVSALVAQLSGVVLGDGSALRLAATAFLAGGVILNVLKEELPEERKSRIAPFFIGAFGYAAILLLA